MFKTLKKLMGLSSPVSVTEDVAEAKQKIKNAEKVTTVTVTPKKTKTVTKGETKASLGKMTKEDIDNLAKEQFGVELDRRLTKDKMVTAFLSAQKKAK